MKVFQSNLGKTYHRRTSPVADQELHTEKLQKVLARLGIASRRASEDLIVQRRVSVNGRTAQIGQRVDINKDSVLVDDIPVSIKPDLVYYLLYKPVGVISTVDDPQGRQTVIDLVPEKPRVFPVGRLDRESEGLLLLTNDGELTYRLTHPSFGVAKEYYVSVEGEVSRGDLRSLREGIELEDGITAPAKVTQIDTGLLRIVIHEGRNRQIRRMCQNVGHPVLRLIRTRIGCITDRKLGSGEWRPLMANEIRDLEHAIVRDANTQANPLP
jgi:23S rRNA pseudouridine2605 synthase